MTPRQTPFFGFYAIDPGDNAWGNNGQMFGYDKDLLDRLLYLALSGHHHTGADGAVPTPVTAAELTLETTGGQIAADTRIWYTYTLVDDESGMESNPAPIAFIDTPPQIAVPERAGIAWGSTGGTHLPGTYYYVMTAYTDANTNETEQSSTFGVLVPVGTTTNRIVIELPDLPDGADGFNVYRREPGGRNLLYLDSIDMTVATPPTEYVDDNSVAEDCDRFAPVRNTTNSSNAITITLPDDVTPLAAGLHWKVYRTINEDDWASTLLQDVVEETFEGSGIIVTFFEDTGFQTFAGTPPNGAFSYTAPEKVNLTDAAEVQGYLPMGRVSGFPVVVELFFGGVLTAGPGEGQWPNPFGNALVVGAIGALGRGSAPVANDAIIDVEVGRGASPVYTSVYAAQADMPTILVGDNKMETVADATALLADRLMVTGDVLSGNVIQEGGSATPQDEDLTLLVLLYVQAGDEDVSLTWP